MSPRALLKGAFEAAVAAVRAEALLPPLLPSHPETPYLVIGAGKAAADMAACVERHWPPEAPLRGLVITRHGHGMPTRRIQVVEAGHPLPDQQGLAAAERVLQLVRDTGSDEHVLALISGGGSSLLTLPAEGLNLAEVQATLHGLLNSGAPVQDINCVRKHLSSTLAGRLAQACAGRVTAWVLSDVAGDDPSVIASGPFTPDNTTFADALHVLQAWQVTVPLPISAFLQRGISGVIPETPKTGSPCFARVDTRIIGNGATALAAAADYVQQFGLEPVVLGDRFVGEARDLAREFAVTVREISARRGSNDPPVVLLSGGEAQVTVRGKGRGGRNGEFLLALALEALDGVHALAADTDGIDGSAENAGAFLSPDTLARAVALGLDGLAHLEDNDAYGFFSALGDLLLTGPTRTNANDFRAILLA